VASHNLDAVKLTLQDHFFGRVTDVLHQLLGDKETISIIHFHFGEAYLLIALMNARCLGLMV
jgi:hypothetical protein